MSVREFTAWTLTGFLFVTLLVLAAAGGHLYVDRANIAERLERAESNTRHFQGQLAKLEEQQYEEMERVQNMHTVTLWQVQGELDACRNGKQ